MMRGVQQIMDILNTMTQEYGILYLKSEVSVLVRLSVPRSQRALTLYTQRQTALLRPIYPVSAVVGS